jgi:hypothetical protein
MEWRGEVAAACTPLRRPHRIMLPADALTGSLPSQAAFVTFNTERMRKRVTKAMPTGEGRGCSGTFRARPTAAAHWVWSYAVSVGRRSPSCQAGGRRWSRARICGWSGTASRIAFGACVAAPGRPPCAPARSPTPSRRFNSASRTPALLASRCASAHRQLRAPCNTQGAHASCVARVCGAQGAPGRGA